MTKKLELLKQRVEFKWKMIILINTAFYFIIVKSDDLVTDPNYKAIIYGSLLLISFIALIISQNNLDKYLKN